MVTMRAVVVDRYGPPDVARVVEVPRPSPRKGEVLVRVVAAAAAGGGPGAAPGAAAAARERRRVLVTEHRPDRAVVTPNRVSRCLLHGGARYIRLGRGSVAAAAGGVPDHRPHGPWRSSTRVFWAVGPVICAVMGGESAANPDGTVR